MTADSQKIDSFTFIWCVFSFLIYALRPSTWYMLIRLDYCLLGGASMFLFFYFLLFGAEMGELICGDAPATKKKYYKFRIVVIKTTKRSFFCI